MYHLLCGKPPYEGSADHRGQQMLNCVMFTPVNWDRLRRAGISNKGIDFVKRMLVHEPSERASDAQCLQHPWLAHLYDPDAVAEMDAQRIGLSAISEETDDGEELDASQLSLHDGQGRAGVDDDDLEYDDGGAIDTLLRAGGEVPRAMGFQARMEESQDWGDSMPSGIGSLIDRMPGVPAQGESDAGPPPIRRLYGEIGSSALGSSGVLGQDALAAFNMPTHLNMLQVGSEDAGRAFSDDTSMDDTSVEASHESQVTNDGLSEHSLQYPYPLPTTAHAGPAPSLMGTEALVSQMNMASPESAVSAPSVDSKPGTPRTPISRELSPLVTTAAGTKRPAQDDYTIGREALKRSRRELTPDVQHGTNKGHRYTPPAFPVSTSKHTNLTTSKVVRRDSTSAQAIDTVAAQTQTDVTVGQGHDAKHPMSTNEPPRSRHSSSKPEANIVAADKDSKQSRRFQPYQKDPTAEARIKSKGHESKDKGMKERGSPHHSVPEGSKLSVVEARNEGKDTKGQEPKGKEKEARQDPSGAGDVNAVEASKESKGPTNSHDGSTGSNDSSFAPKAPQPDPNDPGFVRPRPVYGKLVSLPHSIVPNNTTVYLNQRITTYGRGDDNTDQFPDIMDDRVARNAFDLVFWRSGIEREMANGLDWTKDPDIQAIIKTRSHRWIWVNDVQVRMGADCWQFGKLYTGDIISVFDDVADKHTTKDFLKFECTFNIGVGKNRRPANEPFELEQEREKYQKAITKQTQEAAKAARRAARKAKKAAEASGEGTSDAPATAPATTEAPPAAEEM